MISGLAALADRNFIVGFLLPVLIVVAAFLNTFQDEAAVGALWSAIANADTFASLTLLLLTIWSGALLLSMFNIAFYRILEGYTGPFATRTRRDAELSRRNQRKEELKDLSAAAQNKPAKSPEWYDYLRARRRFLVDFPPEHLVLPTEFGNVVRACEAYSLQVYGVDCIPTWLRLSGVMPEGFQRVIAAARAEVDFFVNICFLSSGLAVLATTSLLLAPFFVPLHIDAPVLRRLAAAVGGACLAFVAYRVAIIRARAWGDVIRSAFDLYLPALAQQLGYNLPTNKKGRQDFWADINAMFLEATPIDPGKWPRAGKNRDSSG